MRPQICLVNTTGGCGTHLIQELANAAGYQRLSLDFLLALMAWIIREDDPKRLIRSGGLAEESFGQLISDLGINMPRTENELVENLADYLRDLPHNKVLASNFFNLSHSEEFEVDKSGLFFWTLEERDRLRDLFAQTVSKSGRTFNQISFIRHPFDIYFSLKERGTIIERPQRIREYLDLVEKLDDGDTSRVVRYEDLCSGKANLDELLTSIFSFDSNEQRQAACSLIHAGETSKWLMKPGSEIREAASHLGPYATKFNYDTRKSVLQQTPAYRFVKYLRKTRSEVHIIERLLSGDFSVNSAFSRHQRSVPARLWLRLSLLSPARRATYDRYYAIRGLKAPAPRSLRNILVSKSKLLLGGSQ